MGEGCRYRFKLNRTQCRKSEEDSVVCALTTEGEIRVGWTRGGGRQTAPQPYTSSLAKRLPRRLLRSSEPRSRAFPQNPPTTHSTTHTGGSPRLASAGDTVVAIALLVLLALALVALGCAGGDTACECGEPWDFKAPGCCCCCCEGDCCECDCRTCLPGERPWWCFDSGDGWDWSTRRVSPRGAEAASAGRDAAAAAAALLVTGPAASTEPVGVPEG